MQSDPEYRNILMTLNNERTRFVNLMQLRQMKRYEKSNRTLNPKQ